MRKMKLAAPELRKNKCYDKETEGHLKKVRERHLLLYRLSRVIEWGKNWYGEGDRGTRADYGGGQNNQEESKEINKPPELGKDDAISLGPMSRQRL